MRMRIVCLIVTSLLYTLVTIPAFASALSIGTDGINSAGLGLTGNGVGIGQLEFSRPSDSNFDTSTSYVNSNVNPAQVYFITVGMMGGVSTAATINEADEMTEPAIGDTDGHATQVASAIISPSGLTTGVAPQAMLHSAGFEVGLLGNLLDVAAVAGQHIATRNGGQIHAINMSFGIEDTSEPPPDGTSLLSSFVDWSARVHDVLYVVAGDDDAVSESEFIPADNFNGMTVAFSTRDNNGVYRIVASGNQLIDDPFSDRTFIHILAPGDDISVAALGTNNTVTRSGTSFAAPHVTGTVALLQQHGNQQTGWDGDYKHTK
jgi:subtilisin family serine protease